jgi:thiamine biosynthesis lipoprotein
VKGATVELRAIGTTARAVVADPSAAILAGDLLHRRLSELDLAASRFRRDSELSLLQAAPRVPRRVGRTLLGAVRAALWAARVTEGAVDPTVADALCAAGYDRDFAELRGGRAAAAPGVPGWRTVALDPAAGTLHVPAGVRLDLGATAKALVADRIAREIHAATSSPVLVALGGDVAVAGELGWDIGVGDDHERAETDPDTVVRVAAGGVATSSTTVRAWPGGHHIIDPSTGRPAESPWRTVSVAASSCLAANAASTAAIVLGAAAPRWLAQRALPARLVRHDGSVVHVAGWPA